MRTFLLFGSIERQEVLHEEVTVYRERDCWDLEGGGCRVPVGDVIRRHGISTTTYYKWKSKHGGLDASELKRIKELEAQLSEFKQIVADLTLENKAMKGLIATKL